MSDRLLWIVFGLAVAVLAVVLAGSWSTAADCRAAGGIPVRGMTGIECIRDCAREGGNV